MTPTGQPVETWEYAELHILRIKSIGNPPRDAAVVILDQATTTMVESAEDISPMGVINRLGQDGWIIPGGSARRVENNDVPSRIRAFLSNQFGDWGIIRSIDTRWASRRITWIE